MKITPSKKYLHIAIAASCVSCTSILFFMFLYNINSFFKFVGTIISYLMPVVVGLAIAFILNPVLNFFEQKVFKNVSKRKDSKLPRILGIISSLLSLVLIVTIILLFIIPQLVTTVSNVVEQFPTYMTNLNNWINETINSNEYLKRIFGSDINNVSTIIADYIKGILPEFGNIISSITNGAIGIVLTITNIIIGIIISIYIMLDRDKFKAQSIKFLFAIFPKRFCHTFLKISSDTYSKFSNFISGKILDSFIIGIICFVGMIIFKMPFAVLISVIIFVTNLIPFFGPFIGGIPSAVLIMLVNPTAAFWFIIFIILLQQFDGNILSPKIIGDVTGLSAFWVLFALLLGGGLLGILGMIISVPLFAVIYSIIKSIVEAKLRNKELPEETKSYYQKIPVNIEKD